MGLAPKSMAGGMGLGMQPPGSCSKYGKLGGLDGTVEGPEQTARELRTIEDGIDTVLDGDWEIEDK